MCIQSDRPAAAWPHACVHVKGLVEWYEQCGQAFGSTLVSTRCACVRRCSVAEHVRRVHEQ